MKRINTIVIAIAAAMLFAAPTYAQKYSYKSEKATMADIQTTRLRRKGIVSPLAEGAVVNVSKVVISENITDKLYLDADTFAAKYLDRLVEELNQRFKIGSPKCKFVSDDEEVSIQMEVHLVEADDDAEVYGYALFTEDGNEFLSVYLNGNGGKLVRGFDAKLLDGTMNVATKLNLNLLRQY